MSKPSRALIREWKQKLKDSGFVDIEHSDHIDNGMLKASPRLRPGRAEAEHYWVLVGRFLYRWQFESEMEQSIWEGYSNGTTCRVIAAALGTSKDSVNRTIRRLTKEMLALPPEEE